MESKELAILAARAMDQRRGSNITVLKLEDITVLTDYFVVGTGSSRVQTQAIADAVEDELDKAGVRPSRIEGLQEGRWVLMDYGVIIVHVFLEDERNFYNLERLWADAPSLPDDEVFPDKAVEEK